VTKGIKQAANRIRISPLMRPLLTVVCTFLQMQQDINYLEEITLYMITYMFFRIFCFESHTDMYDHNCVTILHKNLNQIFSIIFQYLCVP